MWLQHAAACVSDTGQLLLIPRSHLEVQLLQLRPVLEHSLIAGQQHIEAGATCLHATARTHSGQRLLQPAQGRLGTAKHQLPGAHMQAAAAAAATTASNSVWLPAHLGLGVPELALTDDLPVQGTAGVQHHVLQVAGTTPSECMHSGIVFLQQAQPTPTAPKTKPS